MPIRQEPPPDASSGDGARADLHVHSKYSDRPSDWFLRRIGAPESFVEPLELYHTARQRGFDFVTISDHNRIDGALEIAHLPGTFISNEVTTYFPEDGCKIHCLVSGITERQFERIQEIREDIYAFRRYLAEEDIVHSVAHPFFRVNDRLTPDHFEKLIVLFDRFEAINGTRNGRACQLARAILEQLTPEMLEAFADRHGLEPHHPTPWRKSFTGGSDDHSGRYVGHAFTRTPPAEDVAAYLDHLRAGRHEAFGSHGTSVQLAHCFYEIGASYYRWRFLEKNRQGSDLMQELFRWLLRSPEPAPTPSVGRRISDGVVRWTRSWVSGTRFRNLRPAERELMEELRVLAAAGADVPDAAGDQRTFRLASDASHRLAYSFLCRFAEHLCAGRLIDSLQTFASLGPVALGVAPYLVSFRTQHKDEGFLQGITARFSAVVEQKRRSPRRAWLTDTFAEINGVATTVRELGRAASRRGLPLSILTCADGHPAAMTEGLELRNFTPVGQICLPEYDEQPLAFPPFLEVLEAIERMQASEVVISTPGPMGLVGLAAAALLQLRAVGIYHTDFPKYVLERTDDAGVEELAWAYTTWFYQRMDLVLVPSEATLELLVARGFDRDRLRILRRGVDADRFRPEMRTDGFWSRFGGGDAPGGFRFLYVGRLGKEKNVETLLAAFDVLRRQHGGVQLAVVGDGPLRQQLERRWRGAGITFTGALHGEELARAYASADALAFPSRTDTFGNVVVEAHASGLPAVVFDAGGPQETVRAFDSGVVVPDEGVQAFAKGLGRLVDDEALYLHLRHNALTAARRLSWEGVVDSLWSDGDPPTLAPTPERRVA